MKKAGLVLSFLVVLIFISCTTSQFNETEDYFYEDESLSFEYPKGMTILKEQTGEGRWSVSLNWISKVENKNYFETVSMSNPELRYPYYLEDNDYESWDDLKADKLAIYENDQLAIASSLSVGGQDAVFVDAGGFCEHHYELYINGPTGTVYVLTAGCVPEQIWKDLYKTFVESVVFK